MWWVWLLVSLLVIAAIVAIVLVLLYMGKCKKSFQKAFGDKNGKCLFDAAKKSLSKAHFNTVCKIVENCPTQLHECGQALVALLMEKKMSEMPTLPPDAWDKLMKLCPNLCIGKYININTMSNEEKQQWISEGEAMGQYLESCIGGSMEHYDDKKCPIGCFKDPYWGGCLCV